MIKIERMKGLSIYFKQRIFEQLKYQRQLELYVYKEK